jgi:inosine-uridine nucleoside N-ribohydrolase
MTILTVGPLQNLAYTLREDPHWRITLSVSWQMLYMSIQALPVR